MLSTKHTRTHPIRARDSNSGRDSSSESEPPPGRVGLRKGHGGWRGDIYARIYFKIFTCHHQLEGEERPPTWLVVVVLVSRLDGARQEGRRGRRLGVKSLAAGAQASLSAIGNSILQVSEPQLRGSAISESLNTFRI